MTYNPAENYTPTAEDMRSGPIRDAIEEALEGWAPNYIEDGRVTSYTDWIDRIDDTTLPNGLRLDLGGSYDAPVWKACRRIAKKIADDLR